MTRFFTDKEMQDLQNTDKKVLQDNWNKISADNQKIISDAYTKTKKFWGWQDNSKLQGFDWFDKETQIWIPWVNLVKTPLLKWEGNNNIIEEPKKEIQGLNAVRFKDEPNWNLDLTYDNFQNIYRKQARWEKLGLAEQNFLTDLKLKSQFEWKSMQEIFWIETKQDKERKYQNLAMENRNLWAWDLRNSLASKWLNYDEIEKVIAYHQPYNEYLQTQNELKARSDEAFSKKKELLDKQLAETTHQIEESWKQRMDVLNTWMSFSWFWRSSYALGRRDEVARSVNAEISIARSKTQAELELYQAQLQGADAETLGALSQNLANYTNALKNQQTENAKLAQALNDEANASISQALDNMIALSWVNKNTIDKELSKELWYLVNSKWQAVNLDENWKPIMLLSGRKQEFEEGKEDRDFMYKTYKDDRDFNFDAYKDERNFWFDKEKFAYGMQKDMMDFELKDKELTHQINNDNSKLQIDWWKLGLEKEKLDFDKVKHTDDYNLKTKELNFKMNEDDIKQAKQDKKDYQNAIYTAEDAKTMMDEFESLKWSWQTDRLMPSMSAKIDRLKTSLAFMEVQNLKAKWISMNPMTDTDFNNIKNSVSSLTTSMSSAEYTKEIERIQWILRKWVDRNIWKYWKQFDFDTWEVLEIWSWKRNFSDRDINSMFNWNYVKRKELTKEQKQKISNHFKNDKNFNQADQTAKRKEDNMMKKAMNIALASTRKSWQCWAFVNDYCQKLGVWRIMWDSYASKEKHINSKIPQPWSVAVWNPGGWIAKYWHTWIVKAVNNDWTVTIIDANWKWDEKVMTRKVPIKTILASAWWWKGGFINFA